MIIRYTVANSQNDFSEDLIINCLDDLKDRMNLICHIYDKGSQYWNVKAESTTGELYFVEFSLSLNEHSKQIHIKIYPQRVKIEYDVKLEEVKITIKKYFLKNWDKSRCYWIEDMQVLQLSERIYPKINTAENLLRSFINTVMENEFGVSWWDDYIPYKMKDKYSARKRHLKRSVPSFNDVVDNLLSIDVDDLIDIVTLKVEKWNPQVSLPIEIAIKKNEQATLLSHLKNQMIVSKDLWSEVFQNYFDSAFLDSWKEFGANRNHIAHNKPVDNVAFRKFTDNVDKVIKDINEARVKFEIALKPPLNTGNDSPQMTLKDESGVVEGTVPEARIEMETETLDDESELIEGKEPEITPNPDAETTPETDKEDVEREAEEHFWELEEHYRMEAEANIRILDDDEILVEFEEAVVEIIGDIENKFYFRNDLEIETYDLRNERCTLLKLSSKINNSNLQIIALPLINRGAGSISTLELQLIDHDTIICSSPDIEYFNGEAEFNHDQGYYMPLRENELMMPDLDEFYECLEDKVAEVFPNLFQEAQSINSLRIRDGGSKVTADFPCDECGEEGVSIDESFFEYGKCVCCGVTHSVKECYRCEQVHSGSGDFCEACNDYIENE